MKLRRSRAYLYLSLIVALGGVGAMVAMGNSPRLGLDLEGGISVTLTAVSEEEISPEVLEKTVEIIRQRIDALGGLEPEVNVAGTENIFIQLPGVEDEQQALELIGTTAQLTFRQVEELIPTSGEVEPDVTTPEASPGADGEPEKRMPVLAQRDRKKGDGKKDGRKDGDKDEPSPGPSPSTPPTDVPEITTEVDSSVNDKEVIYPDADDPTLLYRLKPAALTGEVVTKAEAVTDPNTGAWSVTIDMDEERSKAWAELTGKLACLRDEGEQIKSQVAIVLDGVVESAAGMKSPAEAGAGGGVECPGGITGGQTQIDSDDEKSAKDLALVLKTGALPITLEQSEIQKISPTLGRDSLNAGLFAGLLGIVLVMIYMVLYYRALGFVVWAGLTVFTASLYTVTCLLSEYGGFTLSLAGIAGVIVSIGITADSYIVAFERLKDEVRAGKSLRAAVDRGMSRAFKTILVADFVTGSAAAILFWLAVGSVKGFALTLGLATIIDVLVAYFFTRPAVVLLARNKKASEGRMFGLRRALGLPAA